MVVNESNNSTADKIIIDKNIWKLAWIIGRYNASQPIVEDCKE